MRSSGARALWLHAVASVIMDGGDKPPSLIHLNTMVPGMVGTTAINDGHVTAAIVYGEDKRDDYKAGQAFIIGEMIALLRQHGLVAGDDDGLRWIADRDGVWPISADGHDYLIRGQRERRLAKDRNIVGERDEVTGEAIGLPGILVAGKSAPFAVEVIGPRGGTTIEHFEVHPLALAIPPMTEREREALRDSIAKDGVKVPLVLYQKKVLDGRNRLYFASILKKSVRVGEFIGTEEEARRHVAILNLVRRHLTTTQRYLAAVMLFGEEATKETKEALAKGTDLSHQSRRLGPLKSAEPNKPNRSGEWHQIVARKAQEIGMRVEPAGIRAMKPVIDAPQTRAKIESGEITKVHEAHKAALAEKQLPAPTTFHGVVIDTVNKRLGRCIKDLQEILTDYQMPVGGRGDIPIDIADRLDQIQTLAGEVRKVLRERGVI